MKGALFILLFLSSLIGTFGKFPFPQKPSNYGKFKSCVERGGINTIRLVRRSNSFDYKHLNYQWQLRIPHIFPLGFLVVRTVSDVAIAVKCGRASGIALVPKGGGHSYGKYSFGNTDSVVVDLRDLKGLRINEAKMTASVGAGWLIGPLNWRLYKRAKVFIPFGLCPTVGISGFATGGGYGLYTRQFGFAADNIIQLRIVTVNGTFLKANRKRNANLYWALRGGVASNFGIVTQFVFKIHPTPPFIFYARLTFDFKEYASVFDAFQHEVKAAPRTATLIIGLYNNQFLLHFIDSNGTGDNFQHLKSKFPPPLTVTMKYYTYAEFNLFAAVHLSSEDFTPSTKLHVPSDLDHVTRESAEEAYYESKNFYGQRLLGADELAKCQALVQEVAPYLNISFESYGGAINDLAVNETAFVHRGMTLYIVMISYRNPRNFGENIRGRFYLKKFWDVSKWIFGHNQSYQNYVDGELPDYLERYYGSNLPRLIEIKRRYDPNYYFHLKQSIPPRIYN